jgi:hypothetical protein
MLTVGMLVCLFVVSANAFQCNTGIDGAVHKQEYNKPFECCYKYTDVEKSLTNALRSNEKTAHYGVVPVSLNKRGCSQVRYCALLVSPSCGGTVWASRAGYLSEIESQIIYSSPPVLSQYTTDLANEVGT